MFSKGEGNILCCPNTDMSNDEVISPAGCVILNSSCCAAEMPAMLGQMLQCSLYLVRAEGTRQAKPFILFLTKNHQAMKITAAQAADSAEKENILQSKSFAVGPGSSVSGETLLYFYFLKETIHSRAILQAPLANT